jgi:aryl-alcohol dehydrogenase-like predicted oxidoreductase
MNRLALGTVQFGLPYGIANKSGQVSPLEAKAMLQLATASGIDVLDTAIAYGESESCLGGIGSHGYRVVTKLPPVPAECADINVWVEDQISASLNRLGVAAVYGLLLHRSDQLLGANGRDIYLALQGLKKRGWVEKIGVSIYAPSELDAITKRYRLDLVQAPFNLVDRRLLASGWLRRLKGEGIEIHTRSAFLQGLLLMPKTTIPNQFAVWNDLWHTWHEWLGCNDLTALRACLAYPLSFPEIDRVVVGADSTSQLAQVISAANGPPQLVFPELQCEDDKLINPSNWPKT